MLSMHPQIKNFPQIAHSEENMKIKTFIILIFGLFNILGNRVIAQDNDLYFMVDTVSIPKEQRIVKIYKSTSLTYSYEFFCKCIEPYKVNLSFFYVYNKKRPAGIISDYKPNYKYLSWQELFELAEKNKNYFDRNYNLYVVEVLPNKKYMTNLVKMNKYRPPSEDGVVIKPQSEHKN